MLPSWAPKAHLDAILTSNLASKCLSRAPQTFNFARHYSTLATFSKIACFALQVLLDCLLAALGAFLGAFWTQLGASWAPLGLNLGSLGRLWGSSWGLLGASWAPLGPLGRLLGQLGSLWAQNRLQIGRQVSAKLGFQRTSEVRPKQLPILAELLVNYTFVAGWRHMQH